ncbi:MAG: TetR/AcrR family transcriptional regulator, partial [Desulfuromonadaceae bacterium]
MEENNHDRLINVAIKVMVEIGYHGMSIGMLAKMVGVSKSTVAYYFKSKEGILLAVLDNFLPVYLAKFMPILYDNKLSGIEKLHRYLSFHMNMVADKKDVLFINLSYSKFLTGRNKETYKGLQLQFEQQLVKIIRQIQCENTVLFNDMDPSVTAKAIMGMCNHACVWYKKDGPISIEDVATHFFNLLTKGYP